VVRVKEGKQKRGEDGKRKEQQGRPRKERVQGGREGRREDEQEAGRVSIQSKGGFGNETHLGTYQVEGRDRGIPPMVLSLVLVPASRSAHALAAAVYSSFFLCAIPLGALASPTVRVRGCGGRCVGVRTVGQGRARSKEGRAHSNHARALREEERAASLPFPPSKRRPLHG